MTSRSASGNGSARSSVASASVKIALLAPMPSASVATAAKVNPGDCLSRRIATTRSWPAVRYPLKCAHDAISLSSEADALASQPVKVPETLARRFARGAGRHAVRDEIARVHLEMKRDLLVHFLFDGRHPDPRPRILLHWASRIFETPAANARQASVSAVSCVRPRCVRR